MLTLFAPRNRSLSSLWEKKKVKRVKWQRVKWIYLDKENSNQMCMCACHCVVHIFCMKVGVFLFPHCRHNVSYLLFLRGNTKCTTRILHSHTLHTYWYLSISVVRFLFHRTILGVGSKVVDDSYLRPMFSCCDSLLWLSGFPHIRKI